MNNKKRPKLPRGLRWHSESQYIWFIWYDREGRQRKKSTETSDPSQALLFKLRFLEQQETRKQDGAEPPDLTNQPLARVDLIHFS